MRDFSVAEAVPHWWKKSNTLLTPSRCVCLASVIPLRSLIDRFSGSITAIADARQIVPPFSPLRVHSWSFLTQLPLPGGLSLLSFSSSASAPTPPLLPASSTTDAPLARPSPWSWRNRLQMKGPEIIWIIVTDLIRKASGKEKVSELRVVDLLDGLCAKMKPYVPNKAGGREFWLKVEGGVPDSPEMAFNRQATELHSRAIVEFCGQLLETTEEELTEKIRVGEVATGDVERVLCQELSKSCKESSTTAPPAEHTEDEQNDEVVSEVADDPIRAESAKDVVLDVKDTVSMGSDGEL